MTDWRLPENRREAFQRAYSFHLKYRTHPGCVYFWLPGIADALELDDDQRAWLVWLNGNTQNPVTSLLLLKAAPRPEMWESAVAYFNQNFAQLEWDTDRRHQKSKFAVATEQWAWTRTDRSPAKGWLDAADEGWEAVWKYSLSQPYMGRLSAWSMYEYARILLGPAIPDIGSFMLADRKGSQSHRNGLAVVDGWDAEHWEWEDSTIVGVPYLAELAENLLGEAKDRNFGHHGKDPLKTASHVHPDVSRLTMESILCTYKSWHKPNRRYPNVYADMAVGRLRKAESRVGHQFDLLWELRQKHLPKTLRLEDNPQDPGVVPEKQNCYRETGCPPMMFIDYPDMTSVFDEKYYGTEVLL